MNSEKSTYNYKYEICIDCGMPISECVCDKTTPYFIISEKGLGCGGKWETV